MLSAYSLLNPLVVVFLPSSFTGYVLAALNRAHSFFNGDHLQYPAKKWLSKLSSISGLSRLTKGFTTYKGICLGDSVKQMVENYFCLPMDNALIEEKEHLKKI